MKFHVPFLLIVMIALAFFGCETDDEKKSDGPKQPIETVESISVDPTTHTMEVNEFIVLDVTTEPASVTVTWSSSDDTVATVNSSRRVLGISEGTATITATAGGKTATCVVTITKATKNYVEIQGETIVHILPRLVGSNSFGSQLGTANTDGSYTFDGTAETWSGGGAQYTFPVPRANIDTWKISDYQVAEVHFKTTDGSVQAGGKKFGGNEDLRPYPDTNSSLLSFDSAANSGVLVYKVIIGETGSGIGLQRNSGGPATVMIEKVVFSKLAIHTITFSGGDYAGMSAISPISIPDGRTVNFYGSYSMPMRPRWSGHSFTGWKDVTADTDFDSSQPITKNWALTAQWEDGDPVAADMRLNLDPSTWGVLPPSAANTSGNPTWTWPSEYAVTDYDRDTGVLTLTFNGSNRQRAIIPLSNEQIEELMYTDAGGVTFRIVGTVKDEDGNEFPVETSVAAEDNAVFNAEFRLHLGNPSGGGSWNGTTTGLQTSLRSHMAEYATFVTNRSPSLLGWFMIQAMYKDESGNDGTQFGFPKVIITIESVTIELGDTTKPPTPPNP